MTAKQLDDRCKHWLSKNDKVLYAILYNTLDDQLAAASLGETPEEDKKKAKGTLRDAPFLVESEMICRIVL
jgi:hypothetical protein